MAKKKRLDEIETIYDDLMMKASQALLDAETHEEQVAALSVWKDISAKRTEERARIAEEQNAKRNRIAQWGSSILNFSASALRTGVTLFAFMKGYQLEHQEHGMFGYSTSKEAFKQASNNK